MSDETIAFWFRLHKMADFQVLLSKGADGNGQGCHLAACLNRVGTLVVPVQDVANFHSFEVENAIATGPSHDYALLFGNQCVELYLIGARVALDSRLQIDLSQSAAAIVVGATGWASPPGTTDRVGGEFSGTITDFMIFDQQLTGGGILPVTMRAAYACFSGGIEDSALRTPEPD